MSKILWQRWTLIFLLMARLVVGELGHAMPVAGMTHHLEQATTQVTEEAACPEHESTGEHQPMTHHADATDHATAHSEGEHDCCKSGDCECPCLHVPCMALEAAIMNPVSSALLSIPYGADNVIVPRPSGLFRPPA